MIPRTAHGTCPFSTFGPSHLDSDGTMASADPCRLNLASQPGLPLFAAWRQVSPGKNTDFPCTPAPFTASTLDCIGLRCRLPTSPASQPLMGFVFLKSQVCLRLPSDPASRRRPCLQLTVGAINLRMGLSSFSQRPCRAHKPEPGRPGLVLAFPNGKDLLAASCETGLDRSVRMTTRCRWHKGLHPAPRCPNDALWGHRHQGKEITSCKYIPHFHFRC